MNSTALWRQCLERVPVALAVVTMSIVVAACGGGGGSGPTPAVSTLQSASGTVTGFGSVFVDGVEIEDATATVERENADGTTSNVPLKLGQHVLVAHDGKGTASKITVDAAVIGSVSSIDLTTSTLTVAGQSVKANADSAAGPVTVFGGGYLAFADIMANDLVEVHGSPVYDSTAKAYQIQATRIEKKAAITAVRVVGKVAKLDATAKTFDINGLVVDYSNAVLKPSTAALANDLTVAIWGPSGSLKTVGGVATLTASRVRVMSDGLADTVTSGMAQLGGLVSNFDATAKTLEIQGVKVDVTSAIITPVTKTLANGSYVQIKGSFDATGLLVAAEVHITEQNTVSDLSSIRLSGVISSLTDANSFVVRGVPVDASAAMLAPSCAGVTLADGIFVRVVATAQNGTDVVKASSIVCLGHDPLPPFARREVKGTVASFDLTAKTLSLTVTCMSCTSPISVLWTDKTVFEGITVDQLAAALVIKVEGYLNASGVLVAREIHIPGTEEHDAYDKPALPASAASAPASAASGMSPAWTMYRKHH